MITKRFMWYEVNIDVGDGSVPSGKSYYSGRLYNVAIFT